MRNERPLLSLPQELLNKIFTNYLLLKTLLIVRQVSHYCNQLASYAIKNQKDQASLKVALSYDYSFAHLSDGRVFAWGFNKMGGLGIGACEYQSVPNEIQFFCEFDIGIKRIMVGHDYTIVLTHDRRVFSWGNNYMYELGTKGNDVEQTPVEVKFPGDADVAINKIILGHGYNMAISLTGALYAWGRNTYHQVSQQYAAIPITPIQLHFFAHAGMQVTEVALGKNHVAVLTDSGRLFTWGDNQYGQLATGDFESQFTPTEVRYFYDSDQEIMQLISSEDYMMAVTTESKVYSWGRNQFGQLGVGSIEDQSNPSEVVFPVTDKYVIKQLELQCTFSVIVMQCGQVFAWGSNEFGQLGRADAEILSRPSIVPGLAALKLGIIYAAVGLSHVIVMTTDGRIFSWGNNCNQQLGIDDVDNQAEPVEIQYFKERGLVVSSIVSSADHVIALTTQQQCFSWGKNNYGQLGDGTRSDKSAIVEVGFFSTLARKNQYIAAHGISSAFEKLSAHA